MLFAVALLSTSCCEDDPVVPELTLEEQYPEWSDLEWVYTNGSAIEYPQLDINISDDVVTLTITEYDNQNNVEVPVNLLYEGITVTSSYIEFNEPDIGGTEKTYSILEIESEDAPGTVKLDDGTNVFVLK